MSLLARVSSAIAAFKKKPGGSDSLDREIKPPKTPRAYRGRKRRFSPDVLSQAFDALECGNHVPFVQLAHAMERHNFAWQSQMGTRRSTVLAQEIAVEGPEGPQARAVQHLIDSPQFHKLRNLLLDAIPVGFAVAHITWHEEKFEGRTLLMPHFHERDQSGFKWVDGELHRLEESLFSTKSVPLEPDRFVVHSPGLLPGSPWEKGIAIAGAYHVMGLDLGFVAWMDAVDLATRRTYVTETDLQSPAYTNEHYKAILDNVGQWLEEHGSVVLPPGAKTNVLSRDLGTLATLFKAYQEWQETSIANMVNGQSMATQQGSSQAQAIEHRKVMVQRCETDTENLAATTTEQVVLTFLRFNFANPKPYKLYAVPDDTEEKTAKMSAAFNYLKTFDLGVLVGQVTDNLGLETTKPNEPLRLLPPQIKALPAANDDVTDMTDDAKMEDDDS